MALRFRSWTPGPRVQRSPCWSAAPWCSSVGAAAKPDSPEELARETAQLGLCCLRLRRPEAPWRDKGSTPPPSTGIVIASAVPLLPASTETSCVPLDVQRVFREHAPFVVRVVRRLGVAAKDVEDVAQEVFVVVHRKAETFNGQSSIRTWLFGIALRVASDHRRRAHVRREHVGQELPVLVSEAGQPEAVRRRELREQLDRALDTLDDDKRAVFVMYEMEGIPMSEVAQTLGCPLFTAYSRLREARDRVRAEFERGGRP